MTAGSASGELEPQRSEGLVHDVPGLSEGGGRDLVADRILAVADAETGGLESLPGVAPEARRR